MYTGLAIDPSINQLGYSVWAGNQLMEAGLFVWPSKGPSTLERSTTIASKLADYLRANWFKSYSWLAVEDMIIRPNRHAPGLMVCKTVSDVVAVQYMQRFNIPTVWRPLPENWKGSESKLGTEIGLIGSATHKSILTSEEIPAIILPYDIPYRKRTDAQRKAVSDVYDAVGIGYAYLRKHEHRSANTAVLVY